MFAVHVHATIDEVAAVLQKKGYTQINGDRGARLWCSHSPQAGMLLLSTKSKRSCEVEIIAAPWTTESLNGALGLLGGLSITLTLSARSSEALASASDFPNPAASASDVVDPFAEFATEGHEDETNSMTVQEEGAEGDASSEDMSQRTSAARQDDLLVLDSHSCSTESTQSLCSGVPHEGREHNRHDAPASSHGAPGMLTIQEKNFQLLDSAPASVCSIDRPAESDDPTTNVNKLHVGVA